MGVLSHGVFAPFNVYGQSKTLGAEFTIEAPGFAETAVISQRLPLGKAPVSLAGSTKAPRPLLVQAAALAFSAVPNHSSTLIVLVPPQPVIALRTKLSPSR